MKDRVSSPREREIVALLLQGCENGEIARQLNMPLRTVKAYFKRMFLRFGVKSGVKRVKLATLLYRRELDRESLSATHNGDSRIAMVGPRWLGFRILPHGLKFVNGENFNRATWLHKTKVLPKEDFQRQVEKELGAKILNRMTHLFQAL